MHSGKDSALQASRSRAIDPGSQPPRQRRPPPPPSPHIPASLEAAPPTEPPSSGHEAASFREAQRRLAALRCLSPRAESPSDASEQRPRPQETSVLATSSPPPSPYRAANAWPRPGLLVPPGVTPLPPSPYLMSPFSSWRGSQQAPPAPPSVVAPVIRRFAGHCAAVPAPIFLAPPHPGLQNFEALMGELRAAMAGSTHQASLDERLRLASRAWALFNAAWAADPPQLFAALSPQAARRNGAHRDRWLRTVNRLVHHLTALGQADLAERCHGMATRHHLAPSLGALSRLVRALAAQSRTQAFCRVLTRAMAQHPNDEDMDGIISRALLLAMAHHGGLDEGDLLGLYELMSAWVTHRRNGAVPSLLCHTFFAAVLKGRHSALAARLHADLVTGTLTNAIAPHTWAKLGRLAQLARRSGIDACDASRR